MRRQSSGKQNGRDGGRTGMKKWGRKAALFLTGGALLAGSLLLAGCQKEKPAQPEETKAEAMETEAEEETADLRTATETAQGDALRMVESGGRLFFKYRDGIYMIEEESGEMTELCRFADARENGAFWVYRGGLYFDRHQVKEGEDEPSVGPLRLVGASLYPRGRSDGRLRAGRGRPDGRGALALGDGVRRAPGGLPRAV